MQLINNKENTRKRKNSLITEVYGVHHISLNDQNYTSLEFDDFA